MYFIPLPELIFSSDLKCIAATDCESLIAFSVTAEDGTTIFETSIWPDHDKIARVDLSDVVNDYLAESDIVVERLRFSAGSASSTQVQNVVVISCRSAMPQALGWIDNHFLLTDEAASIVTVPANDAIYWVTRLKDDQMKASLGIYTHNGRPLVVELDLAPEAVVGDFAVYAVNVPAEIEATLDQEDFRKIKAYNLTVGNRSRTWYVTDRADLWELSVTNEFNVPERFCFPGSLSTKSKRSSSIASIDNRPREYDIDGETEFTLSAKILRGTAYKLSRIIDSGSVSVKKPGEDDFRPVSLKSFEVKTQFGESSEVTVTWVTKTGQTPVYDTERIHTDPYDPYFS